MLRLITGGIAGSPLLNPARLRAMYDIAAEHYLEYAALRGDASDNLPGVPGIGEKIAPVLLSQMGSMRAVWADIDHCAGATLVATLDSYCEEVGRSRMGAGVLKRLATPEARERFEFNLSMMSGRTDLDLGLTPDVPGSPGLLPLDAGPGRAGGRLPRRPVDDRPGHAGPHRAAGERRAAALSRSPSAASAARTSSLSSSRNGAGSIASCSAYARTLRVEPTSRVVAASTASRRPIVRGIAAAT